MNFWDDYLKNPPFDVMSETTGATSDSHAVLRRGYQDFDFEELWDFGSGVSGHANSAPLPSFVEHGGYTLCGLCIQSGQDMYGPRWSVFDDDIGAGKSDPALLDLHSISCMVCRRKLMYGLSQIIRRLTFLRDSVEQRYVEEPPLVHGKEVLDRRLEGSYRSEHVRHLCDAVNDEISPYIVDVATEFERITCPDCIASIAADSVDK